MEESDGDTIRALLTFSQHSCSGNMDEALKAIKLIRKLVCSAVDVTQQFCPAPQPLGVGEHGPHVCQDSET